MTATIIIPADFDERCEGAAAIDGNESPSPSDDNRTTGKDFAVLAMEYSTLVASIEELRSELHQLKEAEFSKRQEMLEAWQALQRVRLPDENIRGSDDAIQSPADDGVDPIEDEKLYRSYPVELLELSDGIVTALAAAGIRTIGELTDYEINGGNLGDIKRIGTAKAGKISAAMEKFWEDKPYRRAWDLPPAPSEKTSEPATAFASPAPANTPPARVEEVPFDDI